MTIRRVEVRLSDAQYEAVANLAELDGVNMADVLRQALDVYLRRRKVQIALDVEIGRGRRGQGRRTKEQQI